MKKLMLIAALGCTALGLISCEQKKIDNAIHVKDVQVDADTIVIEVGQTAQINGTVIPSNATYGTIEWSSTSSGVASVDQTGLVKGLGPGSCWICAMADNILGGTFVTVEAPPVHYIDENGIDWGAASVVTGHYAADDYLPSSSLTTDDITVVWAPVNCGATVANPEGLFYQWGRKQGVTAASTKANQWSGSNGDETEDTFYKKGSNNDWLTTSDDAYWNAGTELSPVKTAYDPCPDGWRVPTAREFFAFDMGTLSLDTVGGLDGAWFFGSNTLASKYKVFLHRKGWLKPEDGTAENAGDRINYWTSTPKSSGKAFYLHGKVSAPQTYYLRPDSGPAHFHDIAFIKCFFLERPYAGAYHIRDAALFYRSDYSDSHGFIKLVLEKDEIPGLNRIFLI